MGIEGNVRMSCYSFSVNSLARTGGEWEKGGVGMIQRKLDRLDAFQPPGFIPLATKVLGLGVLGLFAGACLLSVFLMGPKAFLGGAMAALFGWFYLPVILALLAGMAALRYRNVGNLSRLEFAVLGANVGGLVFALLGIKEQTREMEFTSAFFAAAFIRGLTDEFYLKRVAGLPGERIRIDPPNLLVNGQPVLEPPIFRRIAWERAVGFPYNEVVLGENEYFVLGDNTARSADSRCWGPVPRKNIIGKVVRIYWPLSRAGQSLGSE